MRAHRTTFNNHVAFMAETIQQDLNKYYHIQRQLDEAGGPDNEAGLFEELVLLQENILASFGLPPAQKYIQKLWKFATYPLSEDSIKKAIKTLQQAAEKHLLSPVTTAEEVLERAKDSQASAFDVLPELGFITHDYSIFIYQELFLTGKATARELLQELKKVHQLDYYAKLYHLKHTPEPEFDVNQVFDELNGELKFVQAYLQPPEENPPAWTVYDDDEEEISDLDFAKQRPDYYFEPDATYELVKEPFGVQEIVFSWDSGITLFGHFREKPNRQIMLGCDKQKIQELLSGYSIGEDLLPDLQLDEEYSETEEPVSISLEDQFGTTLFLTEHYLELCQFDEEEGGMPPNFYVVTEVIVKEQYQARENAEEHLRNLSDRYFTYLDLLHAGINNKDARRQTSLLDNELFTTAKLLARIIQTGGNINL